MKILDIADLTVRFGGLTAVNDVSFSVADREIVSLIGPNGAGKTTVFNAVTGIHEAASGDIRFSAKPISQAFDAKTGTNFVCVGLVTALLLTILVNLEPLWETTITANYRFRQPFPWSKTVSSSFGYFAEKPVGRVLVPSLIGFVIGVAGAFAVWQRSRCAPEVSARCGIARTFQNIRLFQQMTVLDNVLIGMDTQLSTNFWHASIRLPRFWREHRQASQQAMEILRFVGLAKESDQLAVNLSYGHQRRLEIARALAMKPRLLFLDEPAAGMNPAEARELMALIQQIRNRGITVLLIEHHMAVVMGISDRIVVLDHGEKIAEGTPAEVC
ncbi:MAG: ABC transporter ATP-binding protein, partial [Gammaproteobacteria bacterium]